MRDRLQSAFYGALGIALFLILWEVIGRYRLVGTTWPPFSAVIDYLLDPARRSLFQRAIGASLASAGLGYVIGAVCGLGLAILGHLVPLLRPGADRFTAIVHSIPSIALAPLFMIFLSRQAAAPALAATGCYFVFYVAGSSGLSSAKAALQDLATVHGASRWARLRYIEIPTALPSLVVGMRLAAPAALIGTILGEWFGAERGLGILIINAMQNFQIALLWSAVVIVATTSLLVFFVVSFIEKAVTARFR